MENQIKRWKKLKTKDKFFEKSFEGMNNDSYFLKGSMHFGTAGIRAKMGAGVNRINQFTIAAATEAYCRFIKKEYGTQNKLTVVVANDNRHNGDLYRKTAVRVMQKNGINAITMRWNKLMSTPFLSFLIRRLDLVGGINITASHNPKDYNGFKVYDNEGAQLTTDKTSIIAQHIKRIDPLKVKLGKYKTKYVSNSLVNEYIERVKSLVFNHSFEGIKVIFSPLHGAGRKIAPKLLKSIGIKTVLAEQQMRKDPDFSWAKSLNTEDENAYDIVNEMAENYECNLILMTDPDADRLGVAVRENEKIYMVSGNELAVVYLDFLLFNLSKRNKIPKNAYIVRSFVSTSLTDLICKKYGIKVLKTDVGFKNIAKKIKETEGSFIMAFEESQGFLLDKELTRDKDSLQAIAATVDVAKTLEIENKNIHSKLEDIYKKYGCIKNFQFSKQMCQEKADYLIKLILKKECINQLKIKNKIDFNKKNSYKIKGNFLKIVLDDGSNFIVRVSGTEPKIKFYLEIVCWENNKKSIKQKYSMIKNFIDCLVEKVKEIQE